MPTTRSGEPRFDAARVYDAVRTAHLERFAKMVPAWVFYQNTRYDFDASLAPPTVQLRQVGRSGAVLALARGRFRAVEVNEPLMTRRWLDLLAQLGVVRLVGLVTRRRTRTGAYCIDLTDPAAKLAASKWIPHFAARWLSIVVLRALVTGIDRLAVGTQGTWELLEGYVGQPMLDRRARLFPALPSACDCPHSAPRHSNEVLFLGAFVERKGVNELMRAWELVPKEISATLRLVGTGHLLGDVQRWARDRPEVSVDVDPPRDTIHDALRRAHVLVLPSQRVGYWREQVGLPIVEALAHGCEVVTTDETGLASWLADHGHSVVSLGSAPADLAAAIVRAVGQERSADVLISDLPDEDSRLAADRWMLAAA